VENLNPRLTYLFQLPEELTALAREIPEIVFCVDLGHLWISSLAHGFEFLQGLREILATGRVVSVHVHDNPSTLGPPPVLADDHTLIGSGRVPIGEALSVLARAGSPRLIIESKAPALENGERLLRLIAGTAGGEIRV
jgi:sugar phosphate isomerase/epimerase